MKKRILIGVVCFILILIGCSVGINGGFLFNTRFFNNPCDAIKSQLITENINIQEDIKFIHFNEYNGLYFGLTGDTEIICAEMKTKDDMYSFTGNYTLFPPNSDDDYSTDEGICFTESSLYNKNGIHETKVKYAVFFQSPYKIVKNIPHQVIKIESKSLDPFWLIYSIGG